MNSIGTRKSILTELANFEVLDQNLGKETDIMSERYYIDDLISWIKETFNSASASKPNMYLYMLHVWIEPL
jgi:hypothetical protein